jgi:hypothetical protein
MLRIITNNVPRLVIDGYELSDAERAEFDYIDFENGDPTFFRYLGRLYDIGEFSTTSTLPEFSPLRKWDGYLSDSFFSGLVIRFSDDFDHVVVGAFLEASEIVVETMPDDQQKEWR